MVPDGNYENNNGFAASAPKDLIDEATNGKLDQVKLSTAAGFEVDTDCRYQLEKGERW